MCYVINLYVPTISYVYKYCKNTINKESEFDLLLTKIAKMIKVQFDDAKQKRKKNYKKHSKFNLSNEYLKTNQST